MFAHVLASLKDAPSGKFVVLGFADALHFVAAPMNTHPYHANIVFSFIQEGGRGEATMGAPTQCVVSTPGWKVLGGGRYEIQASSRILKLSDKSTAYGKYPVMALKEAREALMVALGIPDFLLRLE